LTVPVVETTDALAHVPGDGERRERGIEPFVIQDSSGVQTML
jgi:hypothetical protein